MHHLPSLSDGSSGDDQGFDEFVGFLNGDQSYRAWDRWQNDKPLITNTYITDLSGEAALKTIGEHDPSNPLFVFLAWFAVHSPYTSDSYPDGWDGDIYDGLIWSVDNYAQRLRALYEAKDMWKDTIFVYTSDSECCCAKSCACQCR